MPLIDAQRLADSCRDVWKGRNLQVTRSLKVTIKDSRGTGTKIGNDHKERKDAAGQGGERRAGNGGERRADVWARLAIY